MSTIEIPGYKIVKTLGVGGQATVYLAIQKGFDREVALKVMSPVLAADPSFGERFVREAKIVAKLSHKSIVTVYDVGESGSFYYLAMEYLPGGDLKSKIAEGLKAREALTIISKLAKALHFAHQKGYIHRDVKSENIIFDADGEPLLTDFGIAKASNSSTQMTQTGKLIGTPEYMSPEQCRGKTVDARSDLYSLGVIFYEMLTKGVPYTGEDSVAVCIKHVTKPVPQLPARLKHFQWLIDLLLAKNPDERFQDGLKLSAAIDEFKNSGKQSDSKPKPKPVKKPENKRERSFVATDEEIDSFDDLRTEARSFTQDEPKSKIAPIVTVLVIVLIGAGGFFSKDKWYPAVEKLIAQQSGANDSQNQNSQKTDSTTGAKESITQKDNVRKQPASPDAASLLSQADSLIKKLPVEIGNIRQALQLIGTVRTIDPTNSDADSAFQNTINLVLAQAATDAENQAFDRAEQWVKLVELESPNHALLDATKQKVSVLREQQVLEQSQLEEKELKVAKLLNSAELALSENRLATPPNENAIALYNEVLAIEPENQKAKSGLERVASAYEVLIEKAVAEKSFAKARSMLTRFNGLSSDRNLKIALKDKIAKSEQTHKATIAEKERLAKIAQARKKAEAERQAKLNDPLVQMRLNSSLDSAKVLENEMKLVEPEGNNALEKYQAVLSIDDRNELAKAGIDRIEALILATLTEHIANSKKAEAKQWLAKLQIFNPNHSQLDSFNSSVENIVEPIIEEQTLTSEQNLEGESQQKENSEDDQNKLENDASEVNVNSSEQNQTEEVKTEELKTEEETKTDDASSNDENSVGEEEVKKVDPPSSSASRI